MPNNLSFYESLILMNPELNDEGYQKILEKVTGIIAEEQGEILKKDVWGQRRLAYDIKKNSSGYYVLLYFRAQPGVQKKLTRYYTVTPDIWRNLTLKLDQLMISELLPSSRRPEPVAAVEEGKK
ncbi:MAG: 30S ribosomal protein S6 [Candidatus Wallbacteria bacterium]|nr:30S ribosomal protein S6 [Candidatus Wallbacteria bacterium]